MHITGTIKHNVNDFISFKNIKAEKEIILKEEKVIEPIEEIPEIIEESKEQQEDTMEKKIEFNRKNRNRDKKKDGGKNE